MCERKNRKEKKTDKRRYLEDGRLSSWRLGTTVTKSIGRSGQNRSSESRRDMVCPMSDSQRSARNSTFHDQVAAIGPRRRQAELCQGNLPFLNCRLELTGVRRAHRNCSPTR